MESAKIFAPLPPRPERDSPKGKADNAEWQIVAPVPATAPEANFRHKKHGDPDEVWEYRDADAAVLGYICRFRGVDGKKEILPHTLWVDSAGRRCWRWRSWPVPRPLYGLDRLANRPDSPVLVVEGEKAADAATDHFPDRVSVTSPHGAGSPDKADWSALVGRNVVVWPDRDDAGARYARRVASLAWVAGAGEVRVVDVPADWPEGWDLADPMPDGVDADRLRELLEAARPIAAAEFEESAEQLDAESTTAEPRRLSVTNIDLPAITTEAWEALTAANEPPYLFTFGIGLVRLASTDGEPPTLNNITPDIMRHELARAAEWSKSDKKVENPAPPPMVVCRDLLATANPPLPRLSRIVEAPVFAADGSLGTRPGYQPASRTYFAAAPGFTVPVVPQLPDENDVAKARHLLLEELLGDFPFVDDAERAHAVGLLMLPFIRELIDGPTPLHLIEKPAPGTGAGLLADVLLSPMLGRPVGVMTEGGNEEEWRKRITAKLLTAPSVILIDNVRSRLDSAALAAALTATIWEDRPMGVSEIARVPVRAVWIATGNNPGLSGEMSRRTIRIRLDAKVDRPWQRSNFRHPDLRAWAAAHRSWLVWAALTLVRYWIAEGKPLGEITLGMYEHWAKVTGGILEVSGIPGFLGNLADFYDESDDEGSAWRALVTLWWDNRKDAEVGVSDLFTLVNSTDGESIDMPLGTGGERSQRTRFGKLLAKQRDRQYGEFRITKGGTKQRAQRWKLTQVP